MKKKERTREREWRDKGFPFKRMISGSKSGYRRMFPEHDVMFNANIFTPSGTFWNGDLDITKDCFALQELCNGIGEEMIIVSEMLGWDGADGRTYEELSGDAHAKFTPNQEVYQERVYDGLHGVTIDKMTVVTGNGVDWKEVPIIEWKDPPIGDFDTE